MYLGDSHEDADKEMDELLAGGSRVIGVAQIWGFLFTSVFDAGVHRTPAGNPHFAPAPGRYRQLNGWQLWKVTSRDRAGGCALYGAERDAVFLLLSWSKRGALAEILSLRRARERLSTARAWMDPQEIHPPHW